MKYAIANPEPEAECQLQVLTAQCEKPEDWSHANLRAPYWRVYWNKTSGASILHKRKVLPLEPDKLLIIPPETDFASQQTKPFLHFYIHFLCTRRWAHAKPLALPMDSGLRFLLDRLLPGDELAWNEWLILSLLGRCLASLPESGWITPGEHEHVRLRRALDYMQIHLPHPTPTSVLAAKAGMNLNAFIRVFRLRLGVTPSAYQRRHRIDAACILLHHSGESIEAVAEACGFCDRHHFSRVFKEVRGLAPAEFRSLIGS